MYKKLSLIVTICCCFQFAFGQQSTIKVPMKDTHWVLPENASFEKFDNRNTILLKGKRATVKNLEFTNGTIEVDVYANTARSFAGITFRKQNENIEEVYMRMHKSSQVDAVQYTPIFNNESNWQLYREYQAKVQFKNSGWNSLKIEVNNQNAEVFVNDKKVLVIDDLRTGNAFGEIGLFSLFPNRFSNFRVTHKSPTKTSKTTKNSKTDASIITKWNITKAKAFQIEKLKDKSFFNREYISVTTEKSGLLPISKYIKKSSSGNFERNIKNYTIASKTITVDSEETKLFSFDYSDEILVYLNGKLLFKGNNSFRTKGVQYMGHMDINTNKLYLPLKKGTNKIHCVVIDKANGWGLMAKLD